MSIQKKISVIAFIPLLLLTVVVFHSLEFRVSSWNIDEVIFATGGQKILAGDTLYRDFGDNKPPLIYYTFALMLKLSGPSYIKFLLISKLFTFAVIFLISLGLYFIGNSLGDRTIGAWSAFLFAAYSICSQGSEVLGARSEIYAILMSVIAIYFFVKNNFALRFFDMVMCGVFQSLAVLYNTRFGIMMAAYGLFILYRYGIGKKSFSLIAALAVPLVAAMAAVPLYYYYTGVFNYYTFWQSTIVSHYLGVLQPAMRVASSLMILFFFAGPAPLVFFAGYEVISRIREKHTPLDIQPEPGREQDPSPISRWRAKGAEIMRFFQWDEERQSFMFLMMLFLLQYAAFFTGGKPGVRYFSMMFIPLCLLGAQGFTSLYRQVGFNTIKRDLARAVQVALVLFLAASPCYFFVIHTNTPRVMLNESLKENKRLVEYIQKNTSEKDRIYAWVNVSPIYLQSNRVMATSMIYPAEFLCRTYYYTGNYKNETTAWDIFLKQLKNEKPALIIDDSGGFITKKDKMINQVIKSDYVELKAAEMRDYINDNYKVVDTLDGYEIYKRI